MDSERRTGKKDQAMSDMQSRSESQLESERMERDEIKPVSWAWRNPYSEYYRDQE